MDVDMNRERKHLGWGRLCFSSRSLCWSFSFSSRWGCGFPGCSFSRRCFCRCCLLSHFLRLCFRLVWPFGWPGHYHYLQVHDGRPVLLHHVLDEVNVHVVKVHCSYGLRELGLKTINLVLQTPHLSHSCLHLLPKVGLLLRQWDQLGPHLRPNGLHHSLDLLRDVVVVAEHLVQDEGPFVEVKEDVVAHDDHEEDGCQWG